MNSLREDLGVTHKTIASWVDIFERFYYHFRIYPYQSTIIKSLRKEPKLYLWDWSEVEDENARFENLVACALLKFCHYFFDSQGYKTRLHYIRDKAQKEVDFLVCVDSKPWFCVEVKNNSREISPSLRYFKEKLKIPFSYEVVKESGVDRISDNIRLISASKFLSALI
jgi:predicted AAA+ superfamily ATPase